ncbi:MAG: tetratricopeptide repeat protein [bacterium]|nr:tetratricopeptide repeat protein [bacterium]
MRIIRPLFICCLTALLAAFSAYRFSVGYPWGVDDGVKRLMAEGFASSPSLTLQLPLQSPRALSAQFFPIPYPFVSPTGAAYCGIFPALWPLLGGILYLLCGEFSFYLLPALAFTLFLWLAYRSLLELTMHRLIAQWGVLILAATLVFYGFTYWEHVLALIFLMPLFNWLLRQDDLDRKTVLTGVAFGAAISLRLEAALLYPLIWLLTFPRPGKKWKIILRLTSGMAASLASAALLERVFAGRWFSPQISVNLNLANDGTGFSLASIPGLVFSSPLPPAYFAAGLLIAAVLGLLFKKIPGFAIGLPSLAIVSMLFPLLLRGTVFKMTAFTQGLFFAFPWIGLTITRPRSVVERRFLMLGFGSILLTYLIGMKHPGMHWGPRFLFVALTPLVFVAALNLRRMPRKSARLLIVLTALSAILYGSLSLAVLHERGSACAQLDQLIRKGKARIIITERWHEGADLEPLWKDKTLLWVKGLGDIEELLIGFEDQNILDSLGWLHSSGQIDPATLPVSIQSTRALEGGAGWVGEYLEFRLNGREDKRWAELYWHAARRRTEAGQLSAGADFFRKALLVTPRNPDLHYDLAVCLGKMGDTVAATSELRAALSLNPQHNAAGSLLRQLGGIP